MKGKAQTSGKRHPIQVVARRTGLTPDVLRAWEKRYEAVVPERSPGSRRLYSDADIDRLLLLRRATLGGRSIGQIASLPTGELRSLVESDEAAIREADAQGLARAGRRPSPGDGEAGSHLDSCIAAVERLDEAALEAALARASLALSRAAVSEDVLVPLMKHIGDAWREGTLRIVHEHMASSIVRTFIGRIVEGQDPGPGAPSVVVGTPAGQMHELGSLIAVSTAASEGWRVLYLGANVPAEEFAHAVRRKKARAIALSITYPSDDPRLASELTTLEKLLPKATTLLVGGGAAAAYGSVLEQIGARRLTDMPSFRHALESLRLEPTAA